ncbi:MAG: hypothetical protein CBC42_05810 [Betaproteobacteria bacterium TMED82]|nr:MAG: hypothetical protein CBC42_05810 [Betaproteobacteria bacterium TMED82]
MRILVPIKKVVDYNVRVLPTACKKRVDIENVKMSVNPFDEIALEEAIRLKEKNYAEEICLVTIGPESCEDILRSGLAMGADRAMLIVTEIDLISIQIAQILNSLLKRNKFDLILMGKQAIDDDCNQTGQMLAGLAGLPQATFASELEVTKKSKEMLVIREVDTGVETVSFSLPAVITADLRLNEPRYISLPNIMKAKKKEMEKIELEKLNINFAKSIEVIEISEPEERSKGEILHNVDDLLFELKETLKVI